MKWCSAALIIREMQIKTTHTGQNESESESCSVVSDSLRPHGLYSPWNSLGQNTGVGSLPGISRDLPKPGIKPGLLHCRRILYQLSHKGSKRKQTDPLHSFRDSSVPPLIIHGWKCLFCSSTIVWSDEGPFVPSKRLLILTILFLNTLELLWKISSRRHQVSKHPDCYR